MLRFFSSKAHRNRNQPQDPTSAALGTLLGDISIDDYEYFPLSSYGQGEKIRLLFLDKAKVDDKYLSGRIRIFDLKDIKRKYHALSYVCGDTRTYGEIRFKEHEARIFIGENLYRALRSLATSIRWGKLPIWADNICIHPSNREERIQQILLMRQIYASASFVYVYLGASGADLKGVNRLLLKLRFLIDKHRLRGSPYIGDSDQTRFGFPAWNSPAWNVLNVIRDSLWFERCWTLEEGLLANELRVCNDRTSREFDLRELANLEMQMYKLGIISGNLEMKLGPYLKRMMLISKGKAEFPLVELLSSTIGLKAWKEHDRLYALLGIAKEGGDPELFPSLDDDLTRVCLRYSRHLVKLGYGNALLQQCFDPHNQARLPSWVPDLVIDPFDHHRVIFEPTTNDHVMFHDESLDVLFVKGRDYGVIAQVGSMTAVMNDPAPDFLSLTDRIRRWHSDALSLLSNEPHMYRLDFMDRSAIAWQLLWLGFDDNIPSTLRFVHDDEQIRAFALYMSLDESERLSLEVDQDRLQAMEQFKRSFITKVEQMNLMNRRLFRTSAGLVGLASMWCQTGDTVFAVGEDTELLVLRSLGGDQCKLPEPPGRHQRPKASDVRRLYASSELSENRSPTFERKMEGKLLRGVFRIVGGANLYIPKMLDQGDEAKILIA